MFSTSGKSFYGFDILILISLARNSIHNPLHFNSKHMATWVRLCRDLRQFRQWFDINHMILQYGYCALFAKNPTTNWLSMLCKKSKNGRYLKRERLSLWIYKHRNRSCNVLWKLLTYFPLTGNNTSCFSWKEIALGI